MTTSQSESGGRLTATAALTLRTPRGQGRWPTAVTGPGARPHVSFVGERGPLTIADVLAMRSEQPTWTGPLYGLFGVLEDDGDRVPASLVGGWFHHLVSYSRQAHGLDADGLGAGFTTGNSASTLPGWLLKVT